MDPSSQTKEGHRGVEDATVPVSSIREESSLSSPAPPPLSQDAPSLTLSDAFKAIESLNATVTQVSISYFQLQGQLEVANRQSAALSQTVERLSKEVMKWKGTPSSTTKKEEMQVEFLDRTQLESEKIREGSPGEVVRSRNYSIQRDVEHGSINNQEKTGSRSAALADINSRKRTASSPCRPPAAAHRDRFDKRQRSASDLPPRIIPFASLPPIDPRASPLFDPRLVPFIKTVQAMQLASETGRVRISAITVELLQVDSLALKQFNLAKITDLTLRAQRFLDIVLELGERRGEETIRFRDISQPWLQKERWPIPSYKDQVDYLYQQNKKSYKDDLPAGKHFYPIINALIKFSGSKWLELSTLKNVLPLFDSKALIKSKCGTFEEYVHLATLMCNIEISGTLYSSKEVFIRLYDLQDPFKSSNQNKAFNLLYSKEYGIPPA